MFQSTAVILHTIDVSGIGPYVVSRWIKPFEPRSFWSGNTDNYMYITNVFYTEILKKVVNCIAGKSNTSGKKLYIAKEKETKYFSVYSPQLAQVSFSDHLLSVVCPSVCLKKIQFIFGPISTKLNKKHFWMKGFLFCSNSHHHGPFNFQG